MKFVGERLRKRTVIIYPFREEGGASTRCPNEGTGSTPDKPDQGYFRSGNSVFKTCYDIS